MDNFYFQVRVKQEVFDALKDLSAKEERWLGQQVAVLIREGLERRGYQLNSMTGITVIPPNVSDL